MPVFNISIVKSYIINIKGYKNTATANQYYYANENSYYKKKKERKGS
jgi:hypothetical protein